MAPRRSAALGLRLVGEDGLLPAITQHLMQAALEEHLAAEAERIGAFLPACGAVRSPRGADDQTSLIPDPLVCQTTCSGAGRLPSCAVQAEYGVDLCQDWFSAVQLAVIEAVTMAEPSPRPCLPATTAKPLGAPPSVLEPAAA